MKKSWNVDGELYNLEDGYNRWKKKKNPKASNVKIEWRHKGKVVSPEYIKKRQILEQGKLGVVSNVEMYHTTPTGTCGPVTQSGPECLVVSQEAVGSNPIRTATQREDYGYEYLGTCIGTK